MQVEQTICLYNQTLQARSTGMAVICLSCAKYIHETDETEATSPQLKGKQQHIDNKKDTRKQLELPRVALPWEPECPTGTQVCHACWGRHARSCWKLTQVVQTICLYNQPLQARSAGLERLSRVIVQLRNVCDHILLSFWHCVRADCNRVHERFDHQEFAVPHQSYR